ncbi:zinc-binding protein A33-like [Cheilinus undulatus]|uniref:zinc-binding protein A33-like n=1 Tax=Cheilinus undulatus TaxID=241271 RepID=UPI001BD5AD01|nr:zinc-binding protein A33-like [Cheilinus undulatus]
MEEEDLTCTICCNIFRDPVVLSCSHSFCKDCLQRWWRNKHERECPVCKTVSSSAKPPVSVVLKSLCEAFLLEKGKKPHNEDLCTLHSEKLKLFCLDHQQLVCLICRDSETHSNHTFRPISEAVEQQKQKLQETLNPLKERLVGLKEVKVKFDQTAEHIKVQALHTERRIKKQFQKLHEFLNEEEEARVAALREEEELRSQMMQEKIEALSREIDALSDAVRAAEAELEAVDISFLKNYKAAVQRVQQRPLPEDPPLPSGALIDEIKHLGNLSFNIWKKMKDIVSFIPVILDPNSAHPNLVLSDDLTSVTVGQERQLPMNPERFYHLFSVLGSEGFDSGTHSWDVQVGNSEVWTLGVITESFQRHAENPIGHWRIGYGSGLYTARASPNPCKVLVVRNKVQKLRVNLDCDRRTLSFYDPKAKTQIFTFTQLSSERLFPFLNTADKLSILPSKVLVKVKPRA